MRKKIDTPVAKTTKRAVNTADGLNSSGAEGGKNEEIQLRKQKKEALNTRKNASSAEAQKINQICEQQYKTVSK